MGIFLADNQMISALNTSQGTIVSPIQGYGPSGIPVTYKSLNGNSSGGVSLPSCPVAGLMLPYFLVKHAVQHRQ
jgi:hypothetical protein